MSCAVDRLEARLVPDSPTVLAVLELDEIAAALVVVAHPDDVDFGAAGTVAALTDRGVAVTYCLVTSGEAGGGDRTLSRHEMAALREHEQTAAAKHVGVDDLIFLGHPDGEVEANLDLRRDLARVIRATTPQVVITQSPMVNLDRIYASHPDHRATGTATIDAVYPDARNPFAFPALLGEGLEPHSVDEVWVMSFGDPTGLVDITATIDRKIQALQSHESQISDPDAIGTMLREWSARIAADHAADHAPDHGDGSFEYAEGFKVVDTR